MRTSIAVIIADTNQAWNQNEDTSTKGTPGNHITQGLRTSRNWEVWVLVPLVTGSLILMMSIGVSVQR